MSSFSHLDHITRDLVRGGAIPKTIGQCFAFEFPGGTVRWSIDAIDEAISTRTFQRSDCMLRSMSAAEVAAYVSANPKSMSYVDKDYARTIPSSRLRDPLYAISIPPDVGAAPESVGNVIIIDGNHRLYRAAQLGKPLAYYLLTPEIEKSCRVPNYQKRPPCPT